MKNSKFEKAKEKLEKAELKYYLAKHIYLNKVFGPKRIAKALDITRDEAKVNLDLYMEFLRATYGYDMSHVKDVLIKNFNFDKSLNDYKSFLRFNFKDAMEIARKYTLECRIDYSHEGYLFITELHKHDVSEEDTQKLKELGFEKSGLWVSIIYKAIK